MNRNLKNLKLSTLVLTPLNRNLMDQLCNFTTMFECLKYNKNNNVDILSY